MNNCIAQKRVADIVVITFVIIVPVIVVVVVLIFITNADLSLNVISTSLSFLPGLPGCHFYLVVVISPISFID